MQIMLTDPHAKSSARDASRSSARPRMQSTAAIRSRHMHWSGLPPTAMPEATKCREKSPQPEHENQGGRRLNEDSRSHGNRDGSAHASKLARCERAPSDEQIWRRHSARWNHHRLCCKKIAWWTVLHMTRSHFFPLSTSAMV